MAYASHKLTTVTRSRSRVTGSPQTLTWTIGYNATSGKADRVTDPIDAAATVPDRNKFTYGAGATTVELLRTYGASPTYNTSVYALDALGRVTTLTDPLGNATNTTYDAGSNVTSVDRPDAGITTYTYDTRGNVLTESVPITASSSVTTVMSYSTANDLLTRSEADNESAVKLVTKYTYDGSGHLTTVNVNCTTSGTTPPATASTCTGAGTADAATNLVTSYAYTANDQLAFERDPMGRVTRHAHDTPGNETQVSRNCTSSGTATPSPFDSCTGGGTADHQTNVTTTTAYDQATTAGKAGLATRTTDPVGNQTDLAFDALGRQTGETLPGRRVNPGPHPDDHVRRARQRPHRDRVLDAIGRQRRQPHHQPRVRPRQPRDIGHRPRGRRQRHHVGRRGECAQLRRGWRHHDPDL